MNPCGTSVVTTTFGRLLMVLAIAFAGCGGDGPQEDQIEWLRISAPSNTGVYTTDQAFVTLIGSSFKPAYFDGQMEIFQQCGLTDRYGVTAVNELEGTKLPTVTGEAIWIGSGPSCAGLDVYIRFIDFPLQRGTNRITVTAREVHRIGSAVIVIERAADTTPPHATAISPAAGAVGRQLDLHHGAMKAGDSAPVQQVDTLRITG